MKTRLKIAMVAVPVLAATLFSTAGWSQTYKPDWMTRGVLAKGGTDPSKTVTIMAPSGLVTSYTITFPSSTPALNQLLQTDASGNLSWVDPAASITLTGDVSGTANSNSVVALRGVSLNSDMATPSNANMMIYNSTGTSWHAVAMSGDATISNAGAITLATTGADGATAGAHMVSAINSNSSTGTINVANGGTGASTAGGARTSLGAAASGANSDITALTGVTGAIQNPTAVDLVKTGGTLDVMAAANNTAGGNLTIAGGAGTTNDATAENGGAVIINGGAPAAAGVAGAVDINTTAGNVNIGNASGTTAFAGTVTFPSNAIQNGALQGNGLTAIGSTGSSLTFTGGNGSGAIALGGTAGNFEVNVGHINAWTAQQTFTNSATAAAAATFHNSSTPSSGTVLGATIAVDGVSTGSAGNVALQLTASNSTGSAGNVALDVTAGSVKIEPLNTAGVVHTISTTGVLATSEIVDADVASGAAIAGTKISPDFGSQAVTTSGNISTTGSGTITSAGTLTASNGFTVTTGTVTLPANSVAANSITAGAANTFLTSNGTTVAFTGLNVDNSSGTMTGNGVSSAITLNTAHPNTWSGAQTINTAKLGETQLLANTATGLSANFTIDWGITSTENSVYRISSDAAYEVDGIANGADGRVVVLVNVGDFAITLKSDESTHELTAANRFHFPGGAGVGDLILAPMGTVTLVYDATNSYWRMIAAQ